jgi:CRP/FNR family cyclic AMP-dependent transcriptional regulator
MDGSATLGNRLAPLKYVREPLRGEIASRLRTMTANKGRTLVESGSRSDDVYFILEGEASVKLYSPNGREVAVHAIGPGDLFGEISILDGAYRSASVVASTKLKALVMRADDFIKCLESSPEAGMWLAKRLVS